LVGSVSVPITFFSIRIWQSIHPAVIGAGNSGSAGSFGMTTPMLITMFVCLAAFSVIFVTLLWYRIRLGQLEQQVDQLRYKLME
jgi:heme exporter protein C